MYVKLVSCIQLDSSEGKKKPSPFSSLFTLLFPVLCNDVS